MKSWMAVETTYSQLNYSKWLKEGPEITFNDAVRNDVSWFWFTLYY